MMRWLVRILGAAVGAVLLWLLLDWLIVTDVKRLKALVGTGVDAVNAGRFEDIAPLLAPRVTVDGAEGKQVAFTRADFLEAARRVRRTHAVAELKILELEPKVDGETAVVAWKFKFKAGIKDLNVSDVPNFVRGRFLARKENDRWLLTGVVLEAMGAEAAMP